MFNFSKWLEHMFLWGKYVHQIQKWKLQIQNLWDLPTTFLYKCIGCTNIYSKLVVICWQGVWNNLDMLSKFTLLAVWMLFFGKKCPKWTWSIHANGLFMRVLYKLTIFDQPKRHEGGAGYTPTTHLGGILTFLLRAGPWIMLQLT